MQNIARIQIGHFSYFQSDLLGSGYKSQVFKGQNDLTCELVAIKVCDMAQFTNEVEIFLLNQEITALKSLDSPNIIKMYSCVRNSQFTFIITEYCNQGDLEQLIKSKKQIPEKEAIMLFRYIITGFLEQIAKGIIHRDIKPSNILLNNGVPKIADYGFSKMINSQEKVYYNVGTTLYMSPQALVENQYSEKSDIWSIGVMFYQSVCGLMPWVAETEKEFIKIITSTPVQFSKKLLLSHNLKDFILKCLLVDSKKRISANQLLEHPLFNERPRILQISGSFHLPRGQTQYLQKENVSVEWRRQLSPREVVTQHYNYFNHSSKPVIQNNQTKVFLQNDLILQNVFYLLKLILRIAKLIDHFEFFTSYGLHEKLLYFIIKHALFKSKQFKSMIEQSINTLGLQNFHLYIASTDVKKQYSLELSELHSKFQRSFDRLWERVYENQHLFSSLVQDRKFSAAFDKSELEVVSHYVLMLSILKQAIFELQSQLQIKLNKFTDFQKLEPREEAAILLIDYLVTYTQICNNIIFHFDDFSHRISSFQIKKIVETKPTSINKCKFRDICSQITNLQLML